MVESIARVKHIRVTPTKARRVVNLIRGKQAQEALAILKTDVPVAFFNTRNAGYAYADRLKGFAALDNVAPYSAYTLEHAYLAQ